MMRWPGPERYVSSDPALCRFGISVAPTVPANSGIEVPEQTSSAFSQDPWTVVLDPALVPYSNNPEKLNSTDPGC